MDLLASQQPWDGPETGPADDDDDEMAALDALIAEAEADLSPQTKAAFSKPLQPSQPVDGGQWGSQQPSAAPRAEQAPSRKERDEPRDARTEPRQEKNSGPYSQLRPQLMNTEARPGFQARGGQAGAGKPKVAKPITGDSTVEKFSGLKIKNRVLPSIIVEERLRNIRVLPLRSVRAAVIEGEWATVAVLGEKGQTKETSNGRNYALWTLHDLNKNSLKLFVFGDAYIEHWKELVGSIIAVVNPKMKESDDGKDPAISVDNESQIWKLGTSEDFALCKAERKDGRPCTMVVCRDQFGGLCEFHRNNSIKMAQAIRKELSGGTLSHSMSKKNPRGKGGAQQREPALTEEQLRWAPKSYQPEQLVEMSNRGVGRNGYSAGARLMSAVGSALQTDDARSVRAGVAQPAPPRQDGPRSYKERPAAPAAKPAQRVATVTVRAAPGAAGGGAAGGAERQRTQQQQQQQAPVPSQRRDAAQPPRPASAPRERPAAAAAGSSARGPSERPSTASAAAAAAKQAPAAARPKPDSTGGSRLNDDKQKLMDLDPDLWADEIEAGAVVMDIDDDVDPERRFRASSKGASKSQQQPQRDGVSGSQRPASQPQSQPQPRPAQPAAPQRPASQPQRGGTAFGAPAAPPPPPSDVPGLRPVSSRPAAPKENTRASFGERPAGGWIGGEKLALKTNKPTPEELRTQELIAKRRAGLFEIKETDPNDPGGHLRRSSGGSAGPRFSSGSGGGGGGGSSAGGGARPDPSAPWRSSMWTGSAAERGGGGVKREREDGRRPVAAAAGAAAGAPGSRPATQKRTARDDDSASDDDDDDEDNVPLQERVDQLKRQQQQQGGGAAAAAGAAATGSKRPASGDFGFDHDDSENAELVISGGGGGGAAARGGAVTTGVRASGAGGSQPLAKKPKGPLMRSFDHIAAQIGNRGSAHADLANAAQDAKLFTTLTKLEKQEEVFNEAQSVMEMKVKCFMCVDKGCEARRRMVDFFPRLCREQNHEIREMPSTKRCWECGHCKYRRYNFGQEHPPTSQCKKCDEWAWKQVGFVRELKVELTDAIASKEKLKPRGEEHGFSLKQG